MREKKQTKTKPKQNKLYLKIMLNIKAKLELYGSYGVQNLFNYSIS